MGEFVFKKKYGQNFLSDTNLLNAIADDAQIEKSDDVLEIGAGAGALTRVLSSRSNFVLAYEIDGDLTQPLLSLNLPNVKFVFADFLKAPMKQVESEFAGRFKVVANLPYYITTPIIFKLLEESEKIDSLTIMVQKEVAERICAKCGGKDYGILTVMTEFYGQPQITRQIKRQMFHPAPNVDSALLHIKLERKFPQIDAEFFSKFVKTCFSMRRKTLLNNLSCVFDKNTLRSKLDEQTLMCRAEVLSLEQFVQIYQKLR